MDYLPLIALALATLGLPLWLTASLWRARQGSRLGWLLKLIYASTFLALVLVAGRWDITGYYTRFVLLALFVAATAASWRHVRRLPVRAEGERRWRRYWADAAAAALFAALIVYAAGGYFAPKEAVRLAFPLRDGWFMVGQGGDNPLLNHHNGHPAQRFALDVTALNPAGFRAGGLLPETLESYAIFGHPVVSPCAGTVAAVRDGLPDLTPPARDPENAAGNHVAIRCGEVTVELAHLRRGSVVVGEGETVAAGDRIGAVGNSGNTTEPHLHVHAVGADGAGVPMLFDGRFPVRNATFAR